MKETKLRSFFKGITYRILVTINGIIIVYIFIGKLFVSVLISVVANLVGMIIYYLHERLWNLITWGKN